MKTITTWMLTGWLVLAGSTLNAYDSGKVGFTVQINGEQSSLEIFSVFLLPGSVCSVKSEESLQLSTNNQLKTEKVSGTNWRITAPSEPGAYSVSIKSAKGDIMLNVLVLTPMNRKKGEYLNGYRVGNYPEKPMNGNPIYNAPAGLFEVSEDLLDLKLTPHFTIGQFVCKQAGGFPKYLIVRERLLLKLEYLLEKANAQGYEVETFGFISGYRTPYYNKSIKNVQYSRHVYGGAADIFIDQNKDGSMDDLNSDGVVDEKDVRLFYNLVDEEYNKPSYHDYRGGLGFYRRNSSHKGFIHVDVRGDKARW